MTRRRPHKPISDADFLDPDELDALDVEPIAEPSPASNGRRRSAEEFLATNFRRPPASYRDPYGKWTCKDGREVLFDRSYSPIYSRRPGQPTELADPEEYVRGIVKTEHLWLDGRSQPERSAATRRKLDRLLASWGVRS